MLPWRSLSRRRPYAAASIPHVQGYLLQTSLVEASEQRLVGLPILRLRDLPVQHPKAPSKLHQHLALPLQLAFQEGDALLARLDLFVGARRRPIHYPPFTIPYRPVPSPSPSVSLLSIYY
jgi:hypothetical protein